MSELRTLEYVLLGSTNPAAWAEIEAQGRAVLIVAQRQSHGRGQAGNRWESLPGDLTCSLGLNLEQAVRSQFPANQAFALSQISILALRDQVQSLGVKCEVKWPNDLILRGRKVAGILIETRAQGAHLHAAVMGIGLNLRARPNSPPHFSPPAIGLEEAIGPCPPPQAIARDLALRILRGIGSYAPDENHQTLHQHYLESLMWNDGELHPFIRQGEEFLARIVDVRPGGSLILEEANGRQGEYLFKEVQHAMGTAFKGIDLKNRVNG